MCVLYIIGSKPWVQKLIPKIDDPITANEGLTYIRISMIVIYLVLIRIEKLSNENRCNVTDIQIVVLYKQMLIVHGRIFYAH